MTMSQVFFRNDLHEVIAAKAEDTTNFAQLGHLPQLADVRTIRTMGGLECLISLVAAGIGGKYQTNDWLVGIRDEILKSISQSRLHDITAMLRESFLAANQIIYNDPELRAEGMTAVIAAVHENHLYLAQVGYSRAYLVQDGEIFQLTVDQGKPGDTPPQDEVQPAKSRSKVMKNSLFRFIGKDRNLYVDTSIHLPSGETQDSIDIQPGDGVILCTDGLVENVLLRGEDHHLREDFVEIYDEQPPAVIADRVLQASDPQVDLGRAIVVMKSEILSAPAGVFPIRSSIINQIGLIALILIVSVGLGLGAAYAVPALMNPKSIPNTGPNLSAPSGFLSILAADGLAQASIPGQAMINLSPGSAVTASVGSTLKTGRGTLKFQMIDGTNVYLGNNTSLFLEKLADPKIDQMDSNLVLQEGGILADTSHANGTTVLISAPSPITANVLGTFVGVQFIPSESRFSVDCLEGPCHVSGATTSLDLQSGQAASVINGVISAASPANWDRWSNLCDNDCPIQAPAALPTPTDAPTPDQGVPYLGFKLNPSPMAISQMSDSVTVYRASNPIDPGVSTLNTIKPTPGDANSPAVDSPVATNPTAPTNPPAVVFTAPTNPPTPVAPAQPAITNTPTTPPDNGGGDGHGGGNGDGGGHDGGNGNGNGNGGNGNGNGHHKK